MVVFRGHMNEPNFQRMMPSHVRFQRVLVVDDHKGQLDTVVALLERDGFDVVGCARADEALALVEQEAFAVAVVDLRLSDSDGARLLEQLQGKSQSIRAIIHTGFGSFESAKEAVNLGVFAYVEKSGDPLELLHHVHRAFKGHLSQYAEALEAAVAERTSLLQAREERIQLLLDSTAEAIYGLDLNGRCTFCNPACVRLLGYHESVELLGQDMLGLMHRMRRNSASPSSDMLGLDDVIRQGKKAHVENEILWRSDGSSFPAECWAVPMYRHDIRVGVVVTFVDITERKQSEDLLRKANARLRDLTRELEETKEQERKYIARELHDEFGQILTGLKFDSTWVLRKLQKQGSVAPLYDLEERVRGMNELLDQAIQSVQRMATSLRPAVLDALGLVDALEWQVRDFRRRSGLRCDLSISPETVQLEIPSDASTALFRIIQEVLTNVLRHANAKDVSIRLYVDGEALFLEIQDTGIGITEENLAGVTSYGIRGMEERVSLLGGEFYVSGFPEKGTTVQVTIPIMRSVSQSYAPQV